MQTSTQETTEQNTDTTADSAPDFTWPARLFVTGNNSLLCCSSEPPVNAKVVTLGAPGDGETSGTCNFNFTASQLPGLGELKVQVSISEFAIQLMFWQGDIFIGIYTGNGSGRLSAIGGEGKFDFGACQG